MKLVPGMRVAVGMRASVSAAALIRSVEADVVELDILEDFAENRVRAGDALTLFAPHDGGLHCWSANAAGPTVAGRLSLAVVGLDQIMQRRRCRRFAVDFDADHLLVAGAMVVAVAVLVFE